MSTFPRFATDKFGGAGIIAKELTCLQIRSIAVNYRSGRTQPLMISSGRDQRTQREKGVFVWTFAVSVADCRVLSELNKPEMGMLIRKECSYLA